MRHCRRVRGICVKEVKSKRVKTDETEMIEKAVALAHILPMLKIEEQIR